MPIEMRSVKECGKVLLVQSEIEALQLDTTPGIRIPVTLGIKSGIQVPLTGIQYLKSGIHSVKCRIQDCLGCAWMGGGESNLTPAFDARQYILCT